MVEEPELHRAAVGEHPPVQGGAGPARASTSAARETPITPGDAGRPARRRSASRDRLFEEGVFAHVGGLPDRRPGPGPDPDDRHGRPHRRAARPGAGGVRPRRPRAGRDRRVSRAPGPRPPTPGRGPIEHDVFRRARRRPRRRRDLPLDAHLHTVRSPDANAPLDAYCAPGGRARDRRARDHRPRRLRPDDARPTAFAVVRGPRARRPRGRRALGRPRARDPVRRGGHLRARAARTTSGAGCARHPHDYVIGSVHVSADSPYKAGQRRGVRRRPAARRRSWRRTSTRSSAAARSGLFDTIGHLDFVKRYLVPARHCRADLAAAPELYEPVLRGARRDRDGPGGQRVRPAPARRARPTRRAAIVARYRELGGRHVTIGSRRPPDGVVRLRPGDGVSSGRRAPGSRRSRSGAAATRTRSRADRRSPQPAQA